MILKSLDNHTDYEMEILRDLQVFWDDSSIEIKNKLGLILFTEGVYYSDNSVETTNLSTVLRVFGLENHEKSMMVSEGGLEPP